jgi:hypothetical protein
MVARVNPVRVTGVPFEGLCRLAAVAFTAHTVSGESEGGSAYSVKAMIEDVM